MSGGAVARGRTRRWLAMGAGMLAWGCASGGRPPAGAGGRVARFGFGRPAPADLVAAWDIDVGPDGAGLPPGRGTPEGGAQVFATRCAACHGPTGTEGPYDRLVGREPREGFPFGRSPRLRAMRTVGNYWPYATTLFDYIRRAMPQNDPGSLTADQTYAVIAWILYRNEIVGSGAVMDAGSLVRVRMPARGRFVRDDRTGGRVIR